MTSTTTMVGTTAGGVGWRKKIVAVVVMALLTTSLVGVLRPATAEATGPCDIDGTSVTTNASQAECDALVAIYIATTGAAWTNNTDWNTPTDPCDWFGVTCDATSVVGLVLPSNALAGTIPVDIGALTSLTNLDLSDNNLSGAIPPSIGNLTALLTLNLSSNQLNNVIPFAIGNLVSLTSLNLASNQLSGSLPTQLTGLTGLTSLDLGDNSFTGSIWGNLGDFTLLDTLDLGDNSLTGSIPTSIGSLTALTFLDLGENTFTGSVSSIGALTNLVSLDLDNTGCLSSGVAVAAFLATLGYTVCELSNDLFVDAFEMTSVFETQTGTSVGATREQGETSCGNDASIWWRWTANETGQVSVSTLGSNYDSYIDVFTGTDVAALTSVGCNDDSAGNNDGIVHFAAVTGTTYQFRASGCCSIGGTSGGDVTINLLPSCVGGSLPEAQCDALSDLRAALDGENWTSPWTSVDPCAYSGVTCTASGVTALNLAANGLVGELPASFTNLTALTSLDLSGNGCLTANATVLAYAAGFGQTSSFGNSCTDVCLVNGGYVTTILSQGECDALVAIGAAIPGLVSNYDWGNTSNPCGWDFTLCDTTNLRRLAFGNRNLVGTMPAEIGDLVGLQQLWLNDNQLSGPIPMELASLASLQSLVLNNNELSGEVPETLSTIQSLVDVRLQGNGCLTANATTTSWLAGNFSSSYGTNALGQGCTNLCAINGGTLLTGGMSQDECTALSDMYSMLDGPNWTDATGWTSTDDPCTWTGITCDASGSLTELDLATNALAGTVPATIDDLTAMTSLDLSGNNCLTADASTLTFLTGFGQDTSLGNNCGGIACVINGSYVTTALSQSECDALVAMSLSMPELVSDLGWVVTASDPCTWPNVTCDASGVVQLGLDNWGLTGSIPPEIGALVNLQHLFLSDNTLSGPIPAELGGLVNLQRLYLRNNNFSGPIPAELGQLSNLQELAVDGNQLTGPIPVELGDLDNLQRLWLFDNDLTGSIPAELGGLVNASELYLHDNDLSGEVPQALTSLSLPNSSSLRLQNNGCLTANPATTAWLSANVHSSYGTNALGQGCTNLCVINGGTLITSGMSQNECTALSDLYQVLDGPNWTDATGWETSTDPCGWFGITCDGNGSLVELDLNTNGLVGQVPSRITDLTSMTSLDLSGNGCLTATQTAITFLDGFAQVASLGNGCTAVCLVNGAFVSTVLTQTECDALVAIGAAIPQLVSNYGWGSASNPCDWSRLSCDSSGLYAIHPSGLGLTGTIPPEIGDLTDLRQLQMGNNQLSGSLPPELGNLTNLTQLALLQNDLSGSIPPELGNLTNLTQLVLLQNDLSGSIPLELGNLTNLNALQLEDNNLSGSIPPELGNLTNLNELRLHDNNLSGELPQALTNLTSVNFYSLNLQSNGCLTANAATTAWLAANFNPPYTTDALGQGCMNVCAINGGTLITNGMSQNECTALGDLYTDLDGLNWTDATGWTSTDEPCTWTGVTCDANGSPVELDLGTNGLVGRVGDTIAGLTALTTLDLSGNGCVTAGSPALTFISSLGEATSLGNGCTDVCIVGGGYVSTVASQAECDALVALFVSTTGSAWTYNAGWNTETDPCNWSGVVCDSVGVVILVQAYRGLQGMLPAEIGNLTNLTLLQFAGNLGLVGALPPEIGNLTNLTQLDLRNSGMSGSLPPEIGDLVNLQSLTLDNSSSAAQAPKFSGPFPAEIGNLVNLRVLTANSNAFSGSLPTEIGDLVSLESLQLANNGLSGDVPAEIGQLAQLTSLVLSQNSLTGALPAEIGDLGSLTTLDVAQNQIVGAIPIELGSLITLTALDLADNQISGTIPPEIGGLVNLYQFNASGNQLTGTLPAEIEHVGEATELYEFDISNNQLAGQMPESIVNMSVGHFSDSPLDLGGNGCLTASTQVTAFLAIYGQDAALNLGCTQLCTTSGGTVTTVLSTGECDALAAIFGSLSGANWDDATDWNTAIDPCDWFGITCDSTSLVGLALNDNNLSGLLPPTLGDLWKLKNLDLADNTISGQIPPAIGNLIYLEQLDLGGNDLAGTLPAALWTLDNLTSLDLNDNAFIGTLDADIGQLESLTTLDLSANGLAGSVPATLADIEGLEQLALDNNLLSGALPNSLAELTDVTDLDLSANGCLTAGASATAWITALGQAASLGNSCGNVCTIAGGTATTIATQDECDALVAVYAATSGTSWYVGDGWLTATDPCTWHGVGCSADGITILALPANGLVGGLPADLGDLEMLTQLRLPHNNIVGTIPAQLGSLDDLTVLDLGENDLSGSIPASLFNLSGLVDLDLSRNALFGAIPDSIDNLTQLETLRLSANGLSGQIPTTITSLGELKLLQLNDNNLSGELPQTIGDMASLELLSLHRNQLDGAIPASIGSLSAAQVITLFDNNFSGLVPAEITDLTASALALTNNGCLAADAAVLTFLGSYGQAAALGQGCEVCSGTAVTVFIGFGMTPTSGDDVILGTDGDDTIDGGDGADLICGLAGDDDIQGGLGNDTIHGSDGADTIDGGDDDDVINGDKGDDVLVGAAGTDTINGGAGCDQINTGLNDTQDIVDLGDESVCTPTPPLASFVSQTSAAVLDFAEIGDQFGATVVAGDFNADGFIDVAAGSPSENGGAGAVTVLLGSAAGLQGDTNVRTMEPAAGQASFGAALAVGDYNNDGFDDLAVGAPESTTLGLLNAGSVTVYFGGTQGLLPFGPQTINGDAGTGNAEQGDLFGSALAAGDFDADGVDDLGVGMPGETLGGDVDAGAVMVFNGTTNGIDDASITWLSGNSTDVVSSAEPGDLFGAALTAGDFDADGVDDLAVGMPGETLGGDVNAGAVVVFGGTSGTGVISAGSTWLSGNSPGVVSSAEPGDLFGAALAAGDVDGNGTVDLVVGMPGEALRSVTEAGAIVVFNGTSTGIVTTDSIWISGNTDGLPGIGEIGDHFGSAIAVGAFNGVHPTLAIGIPGESVGTIADAGAIIVTPATQ